jgi:AraC family transcriptional regulator of adaptative response/methylated-DNA-[protein]-cysteine methyltransferase
MEASMLSPDRIPNVEPLSRDAADYEIVRRAIAFVSERWRAQPEIEAIAAAAGVSAGDLHHLFRRWAGITPKAFLQALTLDHARRLLRDSASVLDASFEVGLSGPGRLHDLFVTLEAMTPGEYKAGGAGLAIQYGAHETPFGRALFAMTARGICGVQFIDDERAGIEQLRRQWPVAELRRSPAATAPVAERLFGPLASRPNAALALLVKGSTFQVKVWRALLELPFGSLATYGSIAARIGAPSAARAVGAAVGANPIAWLIPCHRVIRESGALGGYRWGMERKSAMLGWEAARFSG